MFKVQKRYQQKGLWGTRKSENLLIKVHKIVEVAFHQAFY